MHKTTFYRGLVSVALIFSIISVSYIEINPTYHNVAQEQPAKPVIHVEVTAPPHPLPKPTPSTAAITKPITTATTTRPTRARTIANPNKRYLTIYPLDGSAGRLGNFCFRYAAAMAIARANGMTLVLPDTPLVREMRKTFMITAPLEAEVQPRPHPMSYKNITERHWGMFNSDYFRLPTGANIRLTWVYSQSWKYFDSMKNKVGEELQFLDGVDRKRMTYLKTVRERHSPDHIVGLHVRRGDFLQPSHQKWGYAVAPKEYFSTVTKHFVDKFGKNIIFIVASDDRWWCQSNIEFNGAKAQFTPEKNSALEDLAILAACDHHVISVGSFGWWAAWLGKGEVVYFKGFPTPGSNHASNHNPADYYLRSWKGF